MAGPVAESSQRRMRRELAVALLLSLSIHLILAAFIEPQRLSGTFPNEARETEHISSKPASISFAPFKRIAPPAAKSFTTSGSPKQMRVVAPRRAGRPPAFPAAVTPPATAPAASRPATPEGATPGPATAEGKTTEGKSPSSNAGARSRAAASAASAPSGAQTAPTSVKAADEATARLQHMLEGIAASAAPPTPFVATPDAAAIALEARSGYDALINPPPDVVARAIAIISFKRTAGSPDSVVYILRHRRVLGISFCTGWSIVAHPLGGGAPQTGYSTGPCPGDAAALPAWADRLPTLPARAAPSTTPSPQPGKQ